MRNKATESNPTEEARLKRLIGARGLATRYGIHLRTIARWVSRGVIPPPDQYILSRRYWTLGNLEAFDRRRTVEAATRNSQSTSTEVVAD